MIADLIPDEVQAIIPHCFPYDSKAILLGEGKRSKKMQLILDLKDDSKLALVLEAIRRLVSSDGVQLTLRNPDRGAIFDPTDDGFEAQVAALIEEAIEEKATNNLPGKEEIEEAWQAMSAEISQRAKTQ
jgi:hypothetical protein